MKYAMYKPDISWYVGETLKLVSIAVATAYCFYASAYGLLAAIPLTVYLYFMDYRECIERNKKRYIGDFRELLQMVDSDICAGRSLENAFVEAKKECCNRQDIGTVMQKEISGIVRGLQLNRGMEELLIEMGEKSEIDEIKSFAGLVNIAKLHGGNLSGLIRQFISNVSRKKLLEEELETMMSAKKLEGMIMVVMPYAIVLYMRLTGAEYMYTMYTTVVGRVVMTAALIIVGIAMAVMRRIVLTNGRY